MKVTGMLLLSAGFAAGVCASSASASLLQRAPVPDAPVASPGQYRVEFENEFVRVVRVTFEPRAKMVMHQHPAPGAVIVTVTKQDALITAPDGTSREVHYKPGQFRWAVSTRASIGPHSRRIKRKISAMSHLSRSGSSRNRHVERAANGISR